VEAKKIVYSSNCKVQRKTATRGVNIQIFINDSGDLRNPYIYIYIYIYIPTMLRIVSYALTNQIRKNVYFQH
jgi:phosphatidylserine/phosphatidylglycerophosphate/cardiolipin synthase-like enzyme